MSNFSGISKNGRVFKPRSNDPGEVVIARPFGGGYAGQDTPVVFEKSGPVLDTDATPKTDGRGESELGVSGQVDHPNADGGAAYLASQIARAYRQIVAPVGGIENLSVEQRRSMRDELVRRVGADGSWLDGPAADSATGRATRRAVMELASLAFGLIDELSETPDFLREPKPPTPGSDNVGRIGSDYLRLKSVHKSASDVECPHCHRNNQIAKSAVSGENARTGMTSFVCTYCTKPWESNLSLTALHKSSGSSDTRIEDLRKQLADLTAKIQALIARRAGADPMAGRRSGQNGARFITKNAGSDATTAEEELHKALANGVRVTVPGENPFANKARGARFIPRD